MGADGGVEWIPLRDPKKYSRLQELLEPFWQIGWRGNKSGCSSHAIFAHYEWMEKNPIGPPSDLLGFYGTDRGDYCDLDDLIKMLECEEEPFLDFTFRELDIYYRGSYDLDAWSWYGHPWYKCWREHFFYSSHDKVCEEFGAFKEMKVSDWIAEVRSIITLVVHREETWT